MNSQSFPPPQTVWLHFDSGLLGKKQTKTLHEWLLTSTIQKLKVTLPKVSVLKQRYFNAHFPFDVAEYMQKMGDLD